MAWRSGHVPLCIVPCGHVARQCCAVHFGSSAHRRSNAALRNPVTPSTADACMTPLERFAAKRAREKEARQRKAAERREAIEDQYAEVADIIERETISQKILQMLKQDFGAHPEWLGRLPRLAQVAEKVLFWDHEEWRDFEAYTDTTTLRLFITKKVGNRIPT